MVHHHPSLQTEHYGKRTPMEPMVGIATKGRGMHFWHSGGVEVADNIFKTCCALHNWLLEIDGLDGEWDGVNGQHEVTDVLRHAPAALQHLYVNPALMDLSGMGHGNDVENGVMPSNGQVLEGVMNDDDPPETVRVVRNLSLNYFRRKLIEHFDILFQRKELVWPSHRASLSN